MPPKVKTVKVMPHSRVIEAQRITFVCQECKQEFEREYFVGRIPTYCEVCKPIVARRKNRERQRARRRNLIKK